MQRAKVQKGTKEEKETVAAVPSHELLSGRLRKGIEGETARWREERRKRVQIGRAGERDRGTSRQKERKPEPEKEGGSTGREGEGCRVALFGGRSLPWGWYKAGKEKGGSVDANAP